MIPGTNRPNIHENCNPMYKRNLPENGTSSGMSRNKNRKEGRGRRIIHINVFSSRVSIAVVNASFQYVAVMVVSVLQACPQYLYFRPGNSVLCDLVWLASVGIDNDHRTSEGNVARLRTYIGRMASNYLLLTGIGDENGEEDEDSFAGLGKSSWFGFPVM